MVDVNDHAEQRIGPLIDASTDTNTYTRAATVTTVTTV
jgi:hypothetical protein